MTVAEAREYEREVWLAKVLWLADLIQRCPSHEVELTMKRLDYARRKLAELEGA